MDGTAHETVIDVAAMREHRAEATALLKTLANETRLVICCLLVDGERTVTELNEGLDLSQSALSQHLAILREADVVRSRRDGQRIHYALTSGPVLSVIRSLHASYCAPTEHP